MSAKNKIKLDVKEFCKDQLVVHRQYGIGKFSNFELVTVNKITSEYAKLHYAHGDKVYIPVEHLDQIKAYTCGVKNDANKALDSLKSKSWKRKYARIHCKIQEIAINMYAAAKRYNSEAIIYQQSTNLTLMKQMEDGFPFTETSDQLSAIQDVYTDLASGMVMNRLICGDVGFGKTEVALRATFLVCCGKLNNSKYAQVAILCPTTFLARQHYNTIMQRFASFNLNIAQLSRLMPLSEIKRIKNEIATGEIDVIIGTHAMLSKDVHFKNLGLIICDEEQLFGVKQKDHLKTVAPQAHFLTLSATPIPRTLQLAMHEILDISIISTPPNGRMAIQSSIITFNSAQIFDIIARERKRGGCTFLITPRIAYINKLLHSLQKLLPDINIGVMHGNLSTQTMQLTFDKLNNGLYDILIATTIVATGMDFDNINTIIIHMAEMFGLAQLYQIRGRVGRRSKQSYCYFLSESYDNEEYIQILHNINNLSSGHAVACMDLNKRGSGNIAGTEQSGLTNEIGLELYYELLIEAVQRIKFQKAEHFAPEVNIGKSSYIPSSYIDSAKIRLKFYCNIANATSREELSDIRCELHKSFGSLPQELNNLLDIVGIKQLCRKYGVAKIFVCNHAVTIKALHNDLLDIEKLLVLTKTHNSIKVNKDGTINLHLNLHKTLNITPFTIAQQAIEKLQGILVSNKDSQPIHCTSTCI